MDMFVKQIHCSASKKLIDINAFLAIVRNMNLDTFVDISRLFIPVIAVVGMFIVWQQFIANREKLRFELYDKRFNIYSVIIRKLEDVTFGWDEENSSDFEVACNEAKFLLPDSVCEQVELARKFVRNWNSVKNTIEYAEKRGSDSDKAEAIKEEIALIEANIEVLAPKLTEAFKVVLKFEKF
jgi:hypothetical protein